MLHYLHSREYEVRVEARYRGADGYTVHADNFDSRTYYVNNDGLGMVDLIMCPIPELAIYAGVGGYFMAGLEYMILMDSGVSLVFGASAV